MSNEVIERQFEVAAQAELTIKNISGRIDIKTADVSRIYVRATKQGSPRTLENTRIECTQEGSLILIQTKGDKGGLLNLVRSVGSVDYEVTIPRDCAVHAEGISADVNVHDTAAGVRIQTVSGDVVIEHISGEATITTVSGDVTIERMNGRLSLRTTSGDTVATRSQIDHFNLNSVSGDFSIDTSLARGQHYLVKTVSGDLTLKIPAQTGATIQMKSVSGDILCDVPAQVIKSARRNWQGLINGGGASLEMNSVSGDMRIMSNDAHSAAASASLDSGDSHVTEREGRVTPETLHEPEPVGAGAAGTSLVLEALERGEISVEEAISRLDSMR